ncbi:MAG: hypothetical protein KIT36_09860 [Alphaproteobacteria bacterium]|nr:hypothetical protein [Alphaproteobacteria bacterium]
MRGQVHRAIGALVRQRAAWLSGVVLATIVLAAATPALAQAPPPIGHWRSRTSTAQLLVYQNGSCAFLGTQPVQGTCSWNASSRGGILTLQYPMPLEPGKIYFNIIWVNQTTITVFGEYFYRQ